jgi:hypothetical protein
VDRQAAELVIEARDRRARPWRVLRVGNSA